jgi:hypothetical protein
VLKLLPAPIGVIEVDGEYPEAFGSHQAAGRMRDRDAWCGVLVAGVGDDGVVLRAAEPPPPPPPPSGISPTSAAGVVLAAGNDPARDDSPTMSFDVGMEVIVSGPGEVLPEWVLFQYGTVSFTVSQWWLTRYVLGGHATGEDEFLEVVWAELYARSPIDGDTLRERLHCWNVGSQPEILVNDVPGQYMTWSAFFAEGGPINHYVLALQLLTAFSDELVDEWTSKGRCNEVFGNVLGYWDFVEKALTGEEVNREDEFLPDERCDVRFFVRSLDSDFDTRSEPCSEGEVEPCSVGVPAGDSHYGQPYHAWYPVWSGSTTATPYWGFRFTGAGDPTTTMAQAYEIPDARATAVGASRSVYLFARQFAHEGFVLDYAMWMARIAYDYADDTNTTERFQLLEDCALLARFAISRAWRTADLVNAELGHCYLSGTHCEDNQCCWLIAGDHLKCVAFADLGLQLWDTYPGMTGATWQAYTKCSDDDGVVQCSSRACFLYEPGIPGGGAYFWAEGGCEPCA